MRTTWRRPGRSGSPMLLTLAIYMVVLGFVAMLFSRWVIVLALCPATLGQVCVFWAISLGGPIGWALAIAAQCTTLYMYWLIVQLLFPNKFPS